MDKKKIVISSVACGLLLSFSSCINDDYSISKEIDMSVQVGNNLSLPIGTTDTIRLTQMIVEGDMLSTMDGRYVVTQHDRLIENIEEVEEIIVEDFAPVIEPYYQGFTFFNTGKLPVIPGLDNPEINVSYASDVSVRESFDVTVDVPLELKSVKYVKLTDYDYNEVVLNLSLKVSGIPSVIPVLHLVGATLDLPSIIDFEVIEERGSCFKHGSIIYFSEDILLENGAGEMKIPIIVKGLSNPDIKNGVLTLTDEVGFNGMLYVDETKDGDLNLENVTMSIAPQIELPTPQLRVTEVAGTLESDIDLNTSVSFDGLPDFLYNEGTTFGLKDLSLALTVDNPINAPIEIDAVLSAKNDRGYEIDGSRVELNLSVNPAGSSQFLINKSSDLIKSGSLMNLINTIPDHIDLEIVRMVADSNTPEQRLILGKDDYCVEIDYNLQVPLEFDNLRIVYNETISGLQSDLEEITKFVDCLELHADVSHTIPLNMKLKAYPQDAMGNDIDGIELPEELYIEAAPDSEGTEKVSTIDIRLGETRDGALKELDQLLLVIEVENVVNQEVILRPDQFIVLDISVKLPKGISIDLNEL